MVSDRTNKKRFEKVYSSIPKDVKRVIKKEADRRGLQMSDVVREVLMEKYSTRQKVS
jgi:DNA polymerase III delta subunit